ncbi:M20/M25/M40 family metallo-hydrolase [Dokdonella koreensis]|uniref:Bacterial leucyl aminopeptidase n=1 Tax=Dokdonella koreensis DS-123 TaxID=1300342 RepID=A0A160DXV2_9GAMM|nr:M20/M25/M40 family metallo-hydrolase [Dokdonella koreensis]ANB18813.1 Bacterial leucyl aminopeptidase [Dokdonella koreensis DS-123]
MIRPVLPTLFLTAWAAIASATPAPDAAAAGPQYIVTSMQTYQGIHAIAPIAQPRRDSLGTPLMLVQADARQQARITHYVHEYEHRCGGYFAFDSLADAEAFLAGEKTAEAIAAPARGAYTIDNQATVDAWLPQVGDLAIYETISHLSSYRNRYYASPYGREAAEWIRDTWLALAGGRADVTAELFTACTNCSTQPSVILTIRGAELPDEVVVVGAHLDSINGQSTNPEQIAPGADDDASGIATITEIIRVAMAGDWRPRRTVKFMGYAAEEVGLRGSTAIARQFASTGVDVVGVLQLDMTNYKAGPVADMKIISDYSNAALKTFLAELFDTYLAPLGLTRGSYACNYGCSDHASWTSAGFPAVMMAEPGDTQAPFFPRLHTTGDTLANMGDSAVNSAKFARLGLAFVGELAKTAAPENDTIFGDDFDTAPTGR